MPKLSSVIPSTFFDTFSTTSPTVCPLGSTTTSWGQINSKEEQKHHISNLVCSVGSLDVIEQMLGSRARSSVQMTVHFYLTKNPLSNDTNQIISQTSYRVCKVLCIGLHRVLLGISVQQNVGIEANAHQFEPTPRQRLDRP